MTSGELAASLRPAAGPGSADLLGQGDDDARGAAQVAQQEKVLVLRHLAEEVGTMIMRAAARMLAEAISGRARAASQLRRPAPQ
jgi:hypothetical protein